MEANLKLHADGDQTEQSGDMGLCVTKKPVVTLAEFQTSEVQLSLHQTGRTDVKSNTKETPQTTLEGLDLWCCLVIWCCGWMKLASLMIHTPLNVGSIKLWANFWGDQFF